MIEFKEDQSGLWPCPDKGCAKEPFKSRQAVAMHYGRAHAKTIRNGPVRLDEAREKRRAYKRRWDAKRRMVASGPPEVKNGYQGRPRKATGLHRKVRVCPCCGVNIDAVEAAINL